LVAFFFFFFFFFLFFVFFGFFREKIQTHKFSRKQNFFSVGQLLEDSIKKMGRSSQIRTRRQRKEREEATKERKRMKMAAYRADPEYRGNEREKNKQRRMEEKEEMQRLRQRVEQLEAQVEELEERVTFLNGELQRYRATYEDDDEDDDGMEEDEPLAAEEPAPAVEGLEALVAAAEGAWEEPVATPEEAVQEEEDTGKALNDFGKELIKTSTRWLGVDRETLGDLVQMVQERMHQFKATGSPRKNKAPEPVTREEAEVLTLPKAKKKKKKKKKKKNT
jgi:hypothetical protein